jgi:hypothetical protein
LASGAPTLPVGPLPHPALDYAALRAEGLRLLGRLAGSQWTDFNVHDPGITLLEQLCLAITDLGYRTSFPMADLLAGSADTGLPGPATILTCDPVTPDDLRRSLLDLGLGAVRIRAADPPFNYFHHAGSGEVRLAVDPGEPDASPIQVRGVHRVLVQTTEQLSGEAAITAVTTRAQAGRLVGEDHEVGLLDTAEVWVGARIEVGPVDDPVALLADIVEQIQLELAPAPRFVSRAERPGEPVEALYEGPLLGRGFLVEAPEPRDAVVASDLLHRIMDVPGVRAVRSLELAASADGARERWVLPVRAGAVPRLASDSVITLLRAGLPIRVDPAAVRSTLDRRRWARTAAEVDAAAPAPPAGRVRALGRHRSIQRQLPAAYGLAPLGLPESAPASRRAQARQLEAYVLVFDQLLANGLAQLAHAHELLSPASSARTYHAQPPEDPPLDIYSLLRLDPAAFRAWLDGVIEPGDPRDRQKRFLAHLLARFGEEVGDHARVGGDDNPETVVLADRKAFLARIARLGGARGGGWNVGTGAEGGLEERLRLLLGYPEKRRFHLIEHVLLRPVPEDAAQRVDEGEEQIPLLAGVTRSDPWSLRVSFVFEDHGADPDVDGLVARAVEEETPAHVSPELHWFGGEDWTALDAAWVAFQDALQALHAARLAGDASSVQLRFRDARDRVIDLLGFGRTWPLRDLPFPAHVIVPPGKPAQVTLGFSQRGVRYELRHQATGAPILLDGVAIAAEGTGDALTLPTPAIEDDVSYRILAVKLDGADTPELRRETWLRGVVRVEEGVDPRLVARIRLPLLDAQSDAPKDTDARIADYGAAVEIEVIESQEGVVYDLIDDAQSGLAFDAQTRVSDPVVGTSGTIVLTYPKATEDIDLRVRGAKNVGDPQNPELRTATLDVVLLLRVRANPAAEAALAPAILDLGGDARLEVRTTQRSVRYQAWQRAVRDAEFVYDPTPAATVEVLDGTRSIRVLRPDATTTVPDGFTPCGDAKTGNSQKIALLPGTMLRDTALVVTAAKTHAVGRLGEDGGATRGTVVQLARAVVQLVRPDTAPDLRLGVAVAGAASAGAWEVSGGQPGVFYRLKAGDVVAGAEAYVHQRDEVDADADKGIGQLRVERDLALADASALATRGPGTPPIARVDLPAIPVGATVSVSARKATNGLEASLSRTAVLGAVPAVRADPGRVDAGQSARVVIASVLGERYTLARGGVVFASADGTGEELVFDTGPVGAATDFVVGATAADGLLLERRVRVRVEV